MHFVLRMRPYLPALLASLCLMGPAAQAGIVTFEDVGASLPAGGFNNGGPTTNTAGWSSGGVHFQNRFTDYGSFTAWDGWSYSNVQDNVTAGYINQYAAYSEGGTSSGFGSGNSRTYALGFPGTVQNANRTTLSFGSAATVNSLDVTNTTYAVRQFRDGLSPPFGAFPYRDGDYLRLQITGFDGLDGTGNSTGSLNVDLANYGGAGTADDFYIRDWTTVDLSGLGLVRSLAFSMDSNVIDNYGGSTNYLNTPAYFAVDNLSFSAVPEPSSLALVGGGLALLLTRRRRPR